MAAGVVVLRGGGDPDVPPRALQLVDAASGETADSQVAAAAPGRAAGSAGFKVEGTLPQGPSRGAVHTFPASQAPADAVAGLARALGLSGTPRRVGSTWTLTSGRLTLQVLDGPGWQWMLGQTMAGGREPGVACSVTVNGTSEKCSTTTRVNPGGGKVIPIEPPVRDLPADAPDAGAQSGPIQVDPAPGGAAGSGGGSAGSAGSAGRPKAEPPVRRPTAVPIPMPIPTGPRPDEAAVRRAAAPVLAALGLDSAAVAVTGYPALAILTAAPVVDGLPTAGYETRLHYDGAIKLSGGFGWLAPSKPGAAYPLISAQRALDNLPQPEIALACTDREPAGCVLPPTVITGARLGLALRHDARDGALLVPAWLYEVRARGAGLPTLVAIAVDPAYLQPPVSKQLPPVPARPAPGAPNSSSGSSGSSGSGSAGPPPTLTGSDGRPGQPPPTK